MTTSTPAKVFVLIDSIRVVDRHRKDVGDVSELAASIADVGLLHPIVLTPDSRLIAGQRRLEACRQLGWTEVPVHFVETTDDAAALLRAERDENVCRKDMLPSEKASLGEALYAIEEQRAKERQREHGGTAPGRNGKDTSSSLGGSVCRDRSGEAASVVGDALGMSPSTYYELRFAHRTATDAGTPPEVRETAQRTLNEIDQGRGIQSAVRDLRSKIRVKGEVAEAKVAALGAELAGAAQIVNGKRRSRSIPAAQRFAQMRELAASGHTSGQIADLLGYASPETVRTTAREQGIDIPADAVMGRVRKTVDSNRVVHETVSTLEDLVAGLSLVNVDNLDVSQIGHWTASLTESIRALNRLIRQMKEKVQ